MINAYYFCQNLHLQSNILLYIKPLNTLATGIHSVSLYPPTALKHPFCVGLDFSVFFFTKNAI